MSAVLPEITNQKAEREWLYLIDRVGECRALEAIRHLGNRRPFPANIAKVLKIKFPQEDLLPYPPEQQQRNYDAGKAALNEIHKILKGGNL